MASSSPYQSSPASGSVMGEPMLQSRLPSAKGWAERLNPVAKSGTPETWMFEVSGQTLMCPSSSQGAFILQPSPCLFPCVSTHLVSSTQSSSYPQVIVGLPCIDTHSARHPSLFSLCQSDACTRTRHFACHSDTVIFQHLLEKKKSLMVEESSRFPVP